MLDINVFSLKGLNTLTEFTKNIFEYMLQLSYSNINYEKEMFSRFDDELWLNKAYSSKQLVKILDTLLDIALSTTNAEFGSIMLINPQKKELFIKSSRGLSDSVVNNTSVKLGQGISGLAAQERKSFYIDKQISDQRIKNRLYKPNLTASMVIPIVLQDRSVGVVNLATSKTSVPTFNQGNLDTMTKLVDLAGIALGYIHI